MRKLAFLVLVIFCLGVITNVHGQTSPERDIPISLLDKKYSPKEIDSLVSVLRQDFYNGDYEKVVELAPILLRNAEEANSFEQEYSVRSILGNTFIKLDDFDLTFSLLDEGLTRAKKAKDTLAMLSSYIDLGNAFLQREPEKAISYLTTSLALTEDSDAHDQALFITHSNLAELYVGIKKTTEAQFHLDKARIMLDNKAFDEWRDEYMGVIFYTQGAIEIEQQKYSRAITCIRRSLELMKDFDETYVLQNYKNIMSAYEGLGQYKEVNEIRHIHDSIVTKRNERDKVRQQKIAAAKFSSDRYQQELRASRLENKLAQQDAEKNDTLLKAAYISGSVLLILLGLLLYSGYKRNRLLSDLKIKNLQYLEAKDQSEKLARSNTKFLSTISHELRTPLYGIIGLSSVFLEDPALKDHKDDMTSLKFSADYLLALVNDVLNLNKFSSKEGERVLKIDFKLNHLIAQIAQSFEFINKKNNNNLTVNLDPEIPEILYGDKTKVSQVLMNLISNASKFTEDGTIHVEATLIEKTATSNKIAFKIVDTGQGIPEKEQATIFDEFTQVEALTEQQGTGLGLPIVNRILNILDSKLALVSEANIGSTFSFDLSLETGSSDNLESHGVVSEYHKLKDKKILIVDDNKINQVVTRKLLEQYGLKHDTASNGKEAIALVHTTTFDCILMDINMPVMNGLEASKAIRKFNKETPIIALTATNYQEDSSELNESGINDSILKPYKTEKLLALLLDYIP